MNSITVEIEFSRAATATAYQTFTRVRAWFIAKIKTRFSYLLARYK
jgi:hypothetical protein